VFPGEAELGGSAAAVISSNYIPGADVTERYDLDRSQVGIVIKDAAGTEWSSTVRAVFPLAASATSRLAIDRPGAWVTVVLFDLPTTSSFNLGTGPPFLADVIVRINGTDQLHDHAVGSIRITGRGGAGVGGQPTTVLWPPITDLELDSLVMRFRPVVDTGDGVGFPANPQGTTIAGIEGDLVYLSPCLTDFEPYTGSEAAGAGIYVGPEKYLNGFFSYRRLVLTYPQGFTLVPPSNDLLPPEESQGANALGEGPIIDITFDRPNQTAVSCSGVPVWLQNVYVVGPDGSTIADQRGASSPYDSSDLFALYSIPPAPPQ
jgi:hypothetical protein